MTKQFWLDSNFRRDVDETCSLLGYYATNSGNFLPAFRENQSRKVGTKLPLEFLIPEEGNDMFYRNISKKLSMLSAQ